MKKYLKPFLAGVLSSALAFIPVYIYEAFQIKGLQNELNKPKVLCEYLDQNHD